MRLTLFAILPLVTLAFACDKGSGTSTVTEPSAKTAEPVKHDFISDINELITQRFKDKGVTKTECPPMITAETREFDCMVEAKAGNGPKKVPVHAVLKSKGSYDFALATMLFDPVKLNAMVPEALGNAVKDVDCGTGMIYANVGESFECKAINKATEKHVRVTGNVLSKDEIQYKMYLQ